MTGDDQYLRFVLGCDHGGYELKQRIFDHLSKRAASIINLTPEYYEPIPYVNIARACCSIVLSDSSTLGILCCGTGIGISIAANRIRGIYAALLYDDFSAEYSRRHTNANVLVFGGRTMDAPSVTRRIDIFLSNYFEGGKYAQRNKEIDYTDNEGL